MKATNTPPPMTKASDGSHVPKRSRKLSTFAGSDMPETTSPTPNNKPISRLTRNDTASASDQMAGDEDGREGRRHEGQGRSDGPHRQTREAADAMAAGTAAAEAGAETDRKACNAHQRDVGGYALQDRRAGQGHDHEG